MTGGGESLRARVRARSGDAGFSLADHATDDKLGLKRPEVERELEGDFGERLAGLQERLWAEGRRSLLVILQAMDCGGKDGTITHVIGLVNPQGVTIKSFKAPTPSERRHDFLWRIRKALPAPGWIGIHNRSHYEDVLFPVVHGELDPATVALRYGQINAFEQELMDAGTTVVKFFLHISREEQRERLLERLRDPDKRWKFNPRDLAERERWDAYQAAYAAAIGACSTDTAPWYVVPADRKWVRNWVVAHVLEEVLTDLHPEYPKADFDVAEYERRLRGQP